MLRKQAVTYGFLWDCYLHAVLWAYRNTPYETTDEKQSFLLSGSDCQTPTEAALLHLNPLIPSTVADYLLGVCHAHTGFSTWVGSSMDQASSREVQSCWRSEVHQVTAQGEWLSPCEFPSGWDREATEVVTALAWTVPHSDMRWSRCRCRQNVLPHGGISPCSIIPS